MQAATQQLDAIHTMLAAGRRSLRIERHTLQLWGFTGGALCFFSNNILTVAQLPDLTQRAIAWLLLLAFVFGSVATLDWQLTRRAKHNRDEAWSFVHRQVLKIFWLLVSSGILLTFAMFFYGGGQMVFAVWLILLGLGLFVHGLFSEEMLEWAGALMMLIGMMSLLTHLPYQTTQWIAASTFAIGLPLLAWMLDQGRALPVWKRLLQSVGWLAAVLFLPWLAHRHAQALPDVTVMPLAAYRQLNDASGLHIVQLPAGTEIPVRIEVSGNVFEPSQPILPLKIAAPIELVLRDGKLTGDARLADGTWRNQESHWLHIPWIKADLTTVQGASASASLMVNLHTP